MKATVERLLLANIRILIFVIIIVPWNSQQEVQQVTTEPNSIFVDNLANLAEELSSSQKGVSAAAAVKTREKLAKISSHWADVSRKITVLKTREVLELTRKAQEAQIASLRFGSIASRLKTAVMSAQEVFDYAFDRYKSLSALARAAENHSSETSKALLLLQYVKSIREKWAEEETARAIRLSQHLQNILYDLRKASESAVEAKSFADMSQSHVVYY